MCVAPHPYRWSSVSFCTRRVASRAHCVTYEYPQTVPLTQKRLRSEPYYYFIFQGHASPESPTVKTTCTRLGLSVLGDVFDPRTLCVKEDKQSAHPPNEKRPIRLRECTYAPVTLGPVLRDSEIGSASQLVRGGFPVHLPNVMGLDCILLLDCWC